MMNKFLFWFGFKIKIIRKYVLPVQNYDFRKPDSFCIDSQHIHTVMSLVPLKEFLLPILKMFGDPQRNIMQG